ncbi:MAG TPA: hypothetical protein VML01_06160 [Bryobacterales bacterium]|nr:hypothetical protein [Bryobacterales bacterium]
MARPAMAIEELTLAQGWGMSRRFRTTLLSPYLHLRGKQKRCCYSGKAFFQRQTGRCRFAHPLLFSQIETF